MRKIIVTQLLVFCVLALTNVAAISQNAPPNDGTYYSTDLGGNVQLGRLSESWVGTPAGYGLMGNTVLLSSVSGPALGAQWEVWCASISTQPVLLTDIRDESVTGEVAWKTEYSGGQFWLASDGPWSSSGSQDFDGVIETMTANTIYVYDTGEISEVHSHLTLAGSFDPNDWPGSCIEISIHLATFVGSTDDLVKPENYPPFMNSSCGPWAADTGAWADLEGITIQIFPCSQSPVEPATWGRVKSLYTD